MPLQHGARPCSGGNLETRLQAAKRRLDELMEALPQLGPLLPGQVVVEPVQGAADLLRVRWILATSGPAPRPAWLPGFRPRGRLTSSLRTRLQVTQCGRRCRKSWKDG